MAALIEQKEIDFHLTSERNKLQEELRDLRDDHETSTQRFALAQELKAKAEVVAYHAENAKASVGEQHTTELQELQAKISAVESLKLSLEGEVSKLRPQVSTLSNEN